MIDELIKVSTIVCALHGKLKTFFIIFSQGALKKKKKMAYYKMLFKLGIENLKYLTNDYVVDNKAELYLLIEVVGIKK